MENNIFAVPKRPKPRVRKPCNVFPEMRRKGALPKSEDRQISPVFERSKVTGPMTALGPFHGGLVSINQNCTNEPKWSYSLLWTEQGPVLKMIPKEPLLQEPENGPDEFSAGTTSTSQSKWQERRGNPDQEMQLPVNPGPLCGRSFIPARPPKPEGDRDRYVVLPLNFNSTGKNMPSVESSSGSESNERIVALIRIEKEFLKEICTGRYKSEFVVCDLLLPPSDPTNNKDAALNSKKVNRYPGAHQMRKSEHLQEKTSEETCRKVKRSLNLKQISDGCETPKKRKLPGYNEMSKYQLFKLPCCTESPLEMTCISSLNFPQKAAPGIGVSSEADVQDAQIQQFMRSQFDEFDEIHHQLNAISFAKPEILSSSATLASLNLTEEPPVDDLLRRHEINASEAAKQVKVALRDVDKNSKEGHRRKSSKKPLRNSYIPRGPLPFEKSLHVSAAVKDVKRKLFSSTPVQVPEANLPRHAPSFTSLVSLKRQPLAENQCAGAVKPDSSSNSASYNAFETSNLKMVSHLSKLPVLKPKSKLTKKSDLENSYLKVDSRVLKPKRKSPFEWMDTYFSKKTRP